MGVNAQIAVPAFVAGEVLTAAEMTQINTGIPVFATTVTRDAAFGGAGEKVLAEGQFAYIEATNTTQYYDGTAWQSVGVTPGLVPIVPTSVAVTGGGASASTSANGQVTFTSCATLLLNGVFSSTYSNYRIIFEGTNSITTTVSMRLSTGGTPNTTANYNHERVVANGGTVAAARVSSATSFTEFFNNVNSTQGDNNSIDIFNPFATKNTGFNTLGYSTSVGGYWQTIGGHFAATTSFDGFQLIPASGASSGTMSVYGYTI
jgi:hypothetical protein